jgi:hypothetical protein
LKKNGPTGQLFLPLFGVVFIFLKTKNNPFATQTLFGWAIVHPLQA